jgi:HlyD family secretion protein
MPTIRRRLIQAGAALGVIVVVTLGVVLVSRDRVKANDREKSENGLSEQNISVKMVHPTLDANYQITVSRPADIIPYYRTEIEARVAGKVKSIRVAAGSAVEKDQLLLQISVPDLDAEEKAKENFVHQRERELLLAQARVEAARAAVNTALANVEEKRTLLRQAKAQTTFRALQFDRMETLLAKNAIDKNVRDEAEKNLEVARASELAAEASRIKAESEVEDAKAGVKVAEAEVARSRELIEVAKSDLAKAQALTNFAKVKAEFRGTIVRRKVDPGSFVQNASTGHPTPLLTLQRTDIVTVVMRVPDNYAPFVTPGTEAIIEVSSLPDLKIHGRVTRFPRSLETAAFDRTMPVEVDLWNGTAEEFKKFTANPDNLIDLKEGPLPMVPQVTGKDALGHFLALMPGTYANMTLVLKDFGHTYLIPSQAVMPRGGRTYLYVVRDGKAHLIPVQVQVDDGNLAKVVRLGDKGQVLGDLSKDEEIIISNQEELVEGQPVNAVLASHASH